MSSYGSRLEELKSMSRVADASVPLAGFFNATELVEDVARKMHEMALTGFYDPVERFGAVIQDGELIGWISFDTVVVSDARLLKDIYNQFGRHQITASDASIFSVIEHFKNFPYSILFVLEQFSLIGTVRYSDLFTQTFRISLLALSLDLEEEALNLIRTHGASAWNSLSAQRMEAALKVGGLRYPGRNLEIPTLLGCTTFIDKLTIISKLKLLNMYSKTDLTATFRRVERIRNLCAHPGGDPSEWSEVTDADKLCSTISWAIRITESMRELLNLSAPRVS